MNNTERLVEDLDDAMVVDGFDKAIIGYVEKFGQNTVSLYSRNKCLTILMESYHMSLEEAEEYFEYNIIGSYVGENTPAFATIYEEG